MIDTYVVKLKNIVADGSQTVLSKKVVSAFRYDDEQPNVWDGGLPLPPH